MIVSKTCKSNQIIFGLILFILGVVTTCHKVFASEPQAPIDHAQLPRTVEAKQPASKVTAPLNKTEPGYKPMTLSINFQSNIKSVERSLSQVQRKVITPATNAALNNTGRTVVKEIRSAVAKDTGLKVGEIKERMKVRKSSFKNLSVEVFMSGRWFNLIRFKAKQTKKGVRAKAWGETKLYKGAFIGNRGRTVFARTSKKRLPIKALVGPNPAVEFNKRIVTTTFQSSVTKRFKTVFERELGFRLAKLR